MSRPVLSRDDGGPRWTLDGRPLRCGDAVELRLGRDLGRRDEAWLLVRWELEWLPGCPPFGSPVLYRWVADDEGETGSSLLIRGREPGATTFDLRWPS